MDCKSRRRPGLAGTLLRGLTSWLPAAMLGKLKGGIQAIVETTGGLTRHLGAAIAGSYLAQLRRNDRSRAEHSVVGSRKRKALRLLDHWVRVRRLDQYSR